MKKIFIPLILILVNYQISNAKKTEKHHQHSAHVHGSATLNIAFDQLKGRIEFKAASDSVVGFEHTAKSEKDKKKLATAIEVFKNDISKMIQFDTTLSCSITPEKVEMISSHSTENDVHDKNHKHGQHSDFIANFSVSCTKTINNSQLKIDFTTFKGIKDLDVTILSGDVQKSIEVKSKPVTVEIK